jgi:hypothetical protein
MEKIFEDILDREFIDAIENIGNTNTLVNKLKRGRIYGFVAIFIFYLISLFFQVIGWDRSIFNFIFFFLAFIIIYNDIQIKILYVHRKSNK